MPGDFMSTKMRMAVIAGADAALKYKQKKPSASDMEVMKHVTENAGDLVRNIDIEM
jgi:hypothetical protein